MITLGEGTVLSGNVFSHGDDKPFGIYFRNPSPNEPNDVIIHLPNPQAIASYVMALLRFLESFTDEDSPELNQYLQQMKKMLEPMLPKRNFH